MRRMGSQHSGRRAATSPSTATNARPLDPDINPWDRQPEETSRAYQAFLIYRDAPERKITMFQDIDGWSYHTALSYSSQWSWGHRAYRWDQHMSAVETKELEVYRRKMNARHRKASNVLWTKLERWIDEVNVATLKPFEVARLLELAAKLERDAAGTEQVTDFEQEKPKETRLADVMGIDPSLEAEMAEALQRLLPKP